MSQEKAALDPKEVLEFLKRKNFDIDNSLNIVFREEFISEKKRDLLLKIICDRDGDELMHDGKWNENIDILSLENNAISYCDEILLESRSHKKKKLQEVKGVLQSTKRILDQLNSILNPNQSNETQNLAQNPILSEEFTKIQKSIENLDEISPSGKNKETKKLVQALYNSLEQLNSNINTNE